MNADVKLSFAHCQPRKQSLDTLLASGAILGLAPSDSLSQLGDISTFITQLIEARIIREEVISLTLISGNEGILSIGGTIQEAIERVEARIESHFRRPQESDVQSMQNPFISKRGSTSEAAGALTADGPDQHVQSQRRALPEEKEDPDGRIHKRQDGGAEHVPTLEDLFKLNRFGRAKPKDQHIPGWKDGWKWSPG